MKHPLIFSLLILYSSLYGDLKFDQEVVEHIAPYGEAEYTAVFNFRNNGLDELEIIEVRSNCSCTIPDLKKKKYAAGEIGSVSATFDYGDREGIQTKPLEIITMDSSGRKEMHEVLLRVIIPKILVLDRRVMLWRLDEEVGSKLIEIELPSGQDYRLRLNKEGVSGFRVHEIVELGEDRYKVWVEPNLPMKRTKESLVFEAFSPSDLNGSNAISISKTVFLLIR